VVSTSSATQQIATQIRNRVTASPAGTVPSTACHQAGALISAAPPSTGAENGLTTTLLSSPHHLMGQFTEYAGAAPVTTPTDRICAGPSSSL
jgi:hypothetical protein